MKAHQIIQTSCRCGINGGGTGFQVYSCDAELFSNGITRSTEYQKLFVYETPAESGISAFGYAHVEGLGPVFNLNTRLDHDYAGEGTRSGNLLNHALLLAGEVDFYPAELFGSELLRKEMKPEEVNSLDPPDPLPLTDAVPAGIISFEEASEWIGLGDRLDTLEQLLVSLFDAFSRNKTLVILDSEESLIWWIASLEYCLPLTLARQVKFLAYSDNPASSSAQVVGSTREVFDANTPTYMHASCVVVDASNPDSTVVSSMGPFLDLIDSSYDLNPEAVSEFVAFANQNLQLSFSMESFDASYAVYNLFIKPVDEWSDASVRMALSYALSEGSEALNARLAQLLFDDLEALGALDSDTYLAILGYLIRRWDSLSAQGQETVKAIAVDNCVKVFSDPSIGISDFEKRFGLISDSCADAGLDVFRVIASSEGARMLFDSERAVPEKTACFVRALTKYICLNKPQMADLTLRGPFGYLFAVSASSLMLTDSSALRNLESETLASLCIDFGFFSNAAISYEKGICDGASRIGQSGLQVERREVDALWGACLSLLVERFEVAPSLKWLLWVSANIEEAHYSYIAGYFSQLLNKIGDLQEASRLFATFCSVENLRNIDFANICYPDIASAYDEWLCRLGDKGAYNARAALLDTTLRLTTCCEFVPSLVRDICADFTLKKRKDNESGLVGRIASYQNQSGIKALTGRAALIAAIDTLEDRVTNRSVPSLVASLDSIDFCVALRDASLSKRELNPYMERLSLAILRLRIGGISLSPVEVCEVIDALRLVPPFLDRLVECMLECAQAQFEKAESTEWLGVTCTFIVCANSTVVENACISKLASIKDERRQLFSSAARSCISRNAGRERIPLLKKWDQIVEASSQKRRKGLLGFFN